MEGRGADLLYRYSGILTRIETRINGREGGVKYPLYMVSLISTA